MIPPDELRQNLSSSTFFKDISDAHKRDSIACFSGTLYGLSAKKDTIISLTLNPRQIVSTICSSPIHGVEHIDPSENGSLLIWGSTGVSVVYSPVRPGSTASPVSIRLGSDYIISAKWNGTYIMVLKSNNEMLIFQNESDKPLILPNLTVKDNIVDFLPLANNELMTICSNGFLRINDDIVGNAELEGDIQLAKLHEDLFVAANAEMAVHIWCIEDEVLIVEKVELALGKETKIKIIIDESCENRYFLFSPIGLNCVSINWLDDMRTDGEISEGNASSIEVMVSQADRNCATIVGAALLLDRAPNSPSFDGPVCCCAMSQGSAYFIPLLSLPSTLLSLKSNSSKSTSKVPQNVIDKLQLVLSKKPTRILPANGASLSTHDQVKIVAKVVAEMKTEHLARGKAAREAINDHVNVLKRTHIDQQQNVKGIESIKAEVRSKAEQIAEKIETINEKQSELEDRLIQVMVKFSQGRMSEAEKHAGKELRDSQQHMTLYDQSIKRLRKLADTLERHESEEAKPNNERIPLLKPLRHAAARIDDLVGQIKSLKIESGL